MNVNDGGGPKQPTGATLKNLSEEKLVSFAIGSQKKSRFQKAREEQEAKRKQDEEEAAKVYKSFVQSFQEDDDDEEEGFDQRGSKKFVRGGGRGSGDVYRMSQSSSAGRPSKNSEMDKLMQEMKVSIYSTRKLINFRLTVVCRRHLRPPKNLNHGKERRSRRERWTCSSKRLRTNMKEEDLEENQVSLEA